VASNNKHKELAMNSTDDIGKLILRLALGILILLHGINKLTGGVTGIEGMLGKAGLPAFLAYGVYLGEVLGAVLVIIGFYARIGAALIFINMIFAIALAHSHQIFMLTPQGGWALELQSMYLFTALALILTGPGRLSINNR
jgi:putative oxidoreductase